MKKTVSQSLLHPLILGIIITSFLVISAVWKTASMLAFSDIDQDMSVAEKVFDKVVEERQENIRGLSDVLSRSNDFRKAVDSGDWPFIEAALSSYASRFNIGILALVNHELTVLASPSIIFEAGQQLQTRLAPMAQGKHSGFFVLDNKLVQLNLYRVVTPNFDYNMLVGVEFDQTLLNELNTLADVDIIVSQPNSNDVVISTLDDNVASNLLDTEKDPSWLEVTFGNEPTYFKRTVNISSDMHSPVDIVFAIDKKTSFDAVTHILITILAFAFIAVFIAFSVSMLFTRNVSKPLSQLIAAVNNVAFEKYGATLDKPSKLKEISDLADAVDGMQQRIKSREKHIRYQAQHDVLTGLYNRAYVEDYFVSQMASGNAIQVIAITVLGFRTINDLYGYQNGDNTIKALAQRLKRWPGISARLAGGEILYISHDVLQ